MGISPAEVRLRRLLATTPQQTNQTKLVHYVVSMREQLSALKGESGHDDLPVISAEKTKEYEKSIDELAEKIGSSALPDVWDSLQNQEHEKGLRSNPVDSRSQLELSDSDLLPQTLSPTLRQRRLQREQEEGRQQGGVNLDSATNQVVQKHRKIQETLTEEMAIFSEQMKNNSLMMEQSLKDTQRVLDGTEEAVEHSLSATNRANVRAGLIYKSSWKTGCFTWLVLFVMCLIFIFMVAFIKFIK